MTPEFDAVPLWDRAQMWSDQIRDSKYSGLPSLELAKHIHPSGVSYCAYKRAKELTRDYAYWAGCPMGAIRGLKVPPDHPIWM